MNEEKVPLWSMEEVIQDFKNQRIKTMEEIEQEQEENAIRLARTAFIERLTKDEIFTPRQAEFLWEFRQEIEQAIEDSRWRGEPRIG